MNPNPDSLIEHRGWLRRQVLNVADNALAEVAGDALVGLTALSELRLDGARLSLTDDSFVSQRTSLTTLSLRRCNFTRAPWPSIARLTALQTLYMSQVRALLASTCRPMRAGLVNYLLLKISMLLATQGTQSQSITRIQFAGRISC